MSEVKKTEETSEHKAEKKQVNKTRQYLAVLIVLLAVVYYGPWNWGPFAGRAHLRPMHMANGKNVLTAKIMDDYQDDYKDIRKTKDTDLAIEKSHAAETKRINRENAVHTLPPRCPETKGWEGDEKYLHLGGCKPGEVFMLVLVEEQEAEEYEAMLFFYGKGSDGRVTKEISKLLMSPYHPFIEPYQIGKLNLASLISPSDTTPADYKLRGRVRFVYGGDGDVLRLRRKAK